MAYPVAIKFGIIKEGKVVVVENPEYLELPYPVEVGDVSDNLEEYVIERNIECIKEVEELKDGEYDCLLAGTWDWESTGVDFESQVEDFEVLIEHKFLAIQPHVDTRDLSRFKEHSALWNMYFNAVKMTGSYLEAIEVIQESLTQDEYDEFDKLAGWLVSNNLNMGHGNYMDQYKQFKKETNA